MLGHKEVPLDIACNLLQEFRIIGAFRFPAAVFFRHKEVRERHIAVIRIGRRFAIVFFLNKVNVVKARDLVVKQDGLK